MFNEHPTWLMLENAKKMLKEVNNDVPLFMYREKAVIEDAIRSLIKLQGEVENKIIEDSMGS